MEPTAPARPRWTRRPEGSTWGDWGPDDQLGRLNLITAERRRAAAQEVREGLAFCLSLPLDLPGGSVLNPRRHPPVLRPTVRDGQPNMNFALSRVDARTTDVICDDLAILHLQYSTQWDSLAHVGSLFDADGDGVPERVFYNGWRAGIDIVGPTDGHQAGVPGWTAPERPEAPGQHDDLHGPGSDATRHAAGAYMGGRRAPLRSTSAAHALGIERIAQTCVQGRGVLVDLRAHLGDARTLVGWDTLSRVLETDGVHVEAGDIVCLHTGFAQRLVEMGGVPDVDALHSTGAALDGRDARLLRWIDDCGMAALVADNYAVEAHPPNGQPHGCASLPLHEHCLFRLGLPLGELWHLTPLARWLRDHGRQRFLLTAPPLRLPGAVGSPATPVATV